MDNFSDDAKKSDLEKYIYSNDPNILYANNKAEIAFENQGKFVELKNGMFVKQINDSSYIFDLDMLLTKEQVIELELYNEINYEDNVQTKGTTSRDAKTWGNNTVYYSMNSNVTSYFKTEILVAINAWSKQTKLKFVERTNQKDYVEFILGDNGSYSKVGRIGGRQYLYLDRKWANRGTAMHEIGHAIGMVHEHQAAVFHIAKGMLLFKWDNIQSEYKSNYVKYAKGHDTVTTGYDDFDYPINSLMIYGSYSNFAIDRNKPVMTFSKFGFGEVTFDAQRSHLSISDRLAVAKKYGYSYDPATDPNLPPI